MQIPGPIVRKMLECWPVARLASVADDGSPHQVPIVFAQADGLLWSPIDGKPKGRALPRRIQNIRHEARVSLLLDHYERDWRRLWWIRVDALAAPREIDEREPEVAAALSALRAKYAQYRDTPLMDDRKLLIRIEAQQIRSWYAGPDLPELPE